MIDGAWPRESPRRIDDRYILEVQLGRGGMGTVHRAFDEELVRVVALKIMREDLARIPGAVARFKSEAQAAARLDHHPGIATLFDVAHDAAADLHYLTMRYISGMLLGEIIANAPSGLPISEFLFIATDVADAIREAHAKGLTHRDLKPANIIINHEKKAVVLDFGLVKGIPGAPLTAPGLILGTPAYMSPEQATGASQSASASTSSLTDVYSLGIVFYEMLTGQKPVRFDEHDSLLTMLAKVATITPERPALVRHGGLDRRLDALVTSMLNKVPADRPSMAAVLLELRRIKRVLAADAPTLVALPTNGV
jgi:serine/threonine protein kinase